MVKTGSGKKKSSGHRRLVDDYDGDQFQASDDVEAQKTPNSGKKKTKGSPSPFKKSKSPDRQGKKEKKADLEEGGDSPKLDGDNGDIAANNNDNDGGESGDVEDLAAIIAADHERMSRSLGTIFDANSNDEDDDDESLFSKDEEIEVAFGMPTVTSSGIARNKKSKRGGRRTGSSKRCCCASRWGRLGCCLVVLIVVAAAVMAPLYFLGVVDFGAGSSGEQQQQQQIGTDSSSPTTAEKNSGTEQKPPPGLKGTLQNDDNDVSDAASELKLQGNDQSASTEKTADDTKGATVTDSNGEEDPKVGEDAGVVADDSDKKETEGGKANAKETDVQEVTDEDDGKDGDKDDSILTTSEEKPSTTEGADAQEVVEAVEEEPPVKEEEEEEEKVNADEDAGANTEASPEEASDGVSPEEEEKEEEDGDESLPTETSEPTYVPEPNAAPEPTAAPTADPRPHDVKVFEALAKVSGADLHVEGSPQNKAAKFMALTDPSGPRDISNPLFLQRYVLATLYYSTAGDEWKPCLGCNPNARPFLSEAHECLWVGIMCLGTGKVVAIDFGKDGVDMSGPLPSELGLLDSLMRLSLPSNKITTIPSSIADTPIVELEVSNNEISYFPTSLYGKRTLEKIEIDRNNFEGPLPDFAAIPKLEHLQAQYNSFTGTIPPSIGTRLSKLRSLDLSFNSLTGGIPAELGQLERLVRLDLDNNNLTGKISPEIVSMPRLITLSASNNMLTGTLPPEVGGLASYWARNGLLRDKVIRLDNNKLSGALPMELSDIQDLVEVSLHGPENQFDGPMPQAICDIVTLSIFSVECSAIDCSCTVACQCIGDYSPPAAEEAAVEDAIAAEANADDNANDEAVQNKDVTVTVEEEQGTTEVADDIMAVLRDVSGKAVEREGSPAYKAAQWIVLFDPSQRTEDDPRLVQRYCLATLFYAAGVHHFLTEEDECSWNGVLCDEDTRMVIGINLQGQKLQGSIPAEVGYLRYLKSLDLSNNNLGGIIPNSLGQTEIETLVLSNNNLRAPFPESLYNKQSIQQIFIDRNLFTGGQPKWALMPNLTHISAFGNNFVGSLDPEMGSLTNLQVYLLSSNQITGPIPEEYTNLVNLEKFEVAENMLSGEIPAALFGLPRLTSFSLANNHLSGKIGRLVRNMGSDWSKEGERKRKFVRLENNYLEGRIPDDLGEVEDLYLATLHGNSFQGKMPETICELEVASSGFSFALYKFTSDCDNVDCSCSKACQCL